MLEYLFNSPQLLDTHIVIPMSRYIEKLFLEMDLVDLAVAFPNLGWSDILSSLALIVGWKLIAGQIEDIAMDRIRVWLADTLVSLAGAVRPPAST